MSAATAKRRRRQAVQNYNHLARIGRGNNNRPIYHFKSTGKLDRLAKLAQERRKLLQERKGKKR